MPYIDFKEDAGDLAYALAVMRATLEATADGILAVDQEGQVARTLPGPYRRNRGLKRG